jgi:hypothetical protein
LVALKSCFGSWQNYRQLPDRQPVLVRSPPLHLLHLSEEFQFVLWPWLRLATWWTALLECSPSAHLEAELAVFCCRRSSLHSHHYSPTIDRRSNSVEQRWETTLKPACGRSEWRKPLTKSTAADVLRWGTGVIERGV